MQEDTRVPVFLESGQVIQSLPRIVAYWMRVIFAYQNVQHAPNHVS
jgi:hypothetical protein